MSGHQEGDAGGRGLQRELLKWEFGGAWLCLVGLTPSCVTPRNPCKCLLDTPGVYLVFLCAFHGMKALGLRGGGAGAHALELHGRFSFNPYNKPVK